MHCKSMLKKIFFFIVSKVTLLLDYLIPKNEILIVFSQRNGNFNDNSKALFEYMMNKQGEFGNLRLVWLTDKKEVAEESSLFCNAYSIRGYWLALRAKTFIISHGLGETLYSKYFSKRKNNIVVWHGTPIKPSGMLNKNLTIEEKTAHIHEETSKYLLFLCSSKMDAISAAACHHLSNDRIMITGLPRNDVLFNPPEIDSLVGVSGSIKSILDKKIILYAPTFRDSEATQFFPFQDHDPASLADFLIDQDAYLLIRPHKNDEANQQRISALISDFGGRFVLADNREVIDVAAILPYVNTIVTDYSSIYIDLLLVDCPCVFIPYDLEEYERTRGILYDYSLVTPGPKVSTEKDFKDSLYDGLNGGLSYELERKRVCDLFHAYQDNKSSERVTQRILSVIRHKSVF